MDQQLVLGRAIAEQRRRRGLSQPELARLLDQPPSWVSRLERGLAQGDAMSLLGAVASALGTPLPLPRTGFGTRPAASTPAARTLRNVAYGECQRRVRSVSRPAPAAALRAKADRAWAMACARDHAGLAQLLDDLLPELQDALSAAPDQAARSALQEVLAASFQACAAALAKLGDLQSAKRAASRALTAAQQAGDLPLAVASAYVLARILLGAGRYAQAEETACKAMAAIAQPAANGAVEAISLRGSLALLRALAAARIGDASAADWQLGIAREMARQLGDASSARSTGLSPDHLALYEAAVAIQTSPSRRTFASGAPR